MPEQVNRGVDPADKKMFYEKGNLEKLQYAQQDIYYLLNRGYALESAVTYVGNRFLLSARQRMALTRATSSQEELLLRKSRLIQETTGSGILHVDGFNIIITLETALSGGTLIHCMDGAVRDLCGLHGTYRIIDKTQPAIDLLLKYVKDIKAQQVMVWLDAPVSNAGRLKMLFCERGAEAGVALQATLVKNADSMLWEQENAVTSDSIILNRCKSWLNAGKSIMEKAMETPAMVDLSGGIQ